MNKELTSSVLARVPRTQNLGMRGTLMCTRHADNAYQAAVVVAVRLVRVDVVELVVVPEL